MLSPKLPSQALTPKCFIYWGKSKVSRFFNTVIILIIALSSTIAHGVDDDLPLNQYQWFGSHNSYKRPLPKDVYLLLSEQDAHQANQINYSHPPLHVQLDIGLRQLEIDVVNDPNGNQYHNIELEQRFGQKWLSPAERDALQTPGFKVMHIPHVDALSHCVTLVLCLDALLRWSQENPAHFPVVILVNAKENQPNFLVSAKPMPFLPDTYAQLDDVFKRHLGRQLITPDDIRGEKPTLRDAIATRGWPSLSKMRGKFLILFDGSESQIEGYTQGNYSLRHRAMFASLPEGNDDAVMFIRNDPQQQFNNIQRLVQQGFVVRTRADADLSASAFEKAIQRDFAMRSGAQIISTDYYSASPQAALSDYFASFPDGELLRHSPQQLDQSPQ